MARKTINVEDAASFVVGAKTVKVAEVWLAGVSEDRSVFESLYSWLKAKHSVEETRRDLHTRTFAGKNLMARLLAAETKRIKRHTVRSPVTIGADIAPGGGMRALFVLGLAACGGVGSSGGPVAPSDPWREPPAARPGVPPASDEAGFRAALVGDVRNAGLWFADAGCAAQFGRPGPVAPDAFDAFARCVAGLHLRPTGLAHWLDDASVLTDDAGFEIEALVVAGTLRYIGFAGRAPGMPDLPTITPEALETLRAGGDLRATISAESAELVVPKKQRTSTYSEHLRLCLNEAGELIAVMPAATTTPASATAFSAVARTWKFRPFAVAGTPMAVCSIASFQYPAGAPERYLPKPPLLSKAGHIIYRIDPHDLEGKRVAGQKLVVPDDEDKTRVWSFRVVGSFQLCLDEAGRYESGTMLKSTGLPRYDAKIVKAMMRWAYRPHLVDGVAVPVCTAVTFIYSQNWQRR